MLSDGTPMIGIRELYDQMVGMNTKLDVALARFEQTDQRTHDHEDRLRMLEAPQPVQRLTDHESRLRNLERWRYTLPVSLVLALGSIGVSVVLAVLNLGG